MNEHKKFGLIDWAGIVLFAFGALGTVLMLLSMSSGRIEQHGPMVVVADTWRGIFGVFPSLFLNAAYLFLGARLFLKRESTMLFKNVAGCALLTVALSVFFGALSTGAGGKIGAYTGEIVTTRAHIALGALVGLVAIFAAAWFSWLRHTGMGRAYVAPAPLPVAAEPKPAKVVARPIAPPMPTRLSTPQTAAAEEGVTAAESAALFPMEEVAPIVSAPVTDPVAHADVIEGAPVLARSPYPEDVRRKGQVPPGAKPLAVPAALQETAPSAYRWTAPRAEPEAPTEDAVREPVAPSFSVQAFSVQGLRPLRRGDGEVEAEATPGMDSEPKGALDVEVEAPVQVPTPSWEQPALFRPEPGDEEPVDAYGTPLTLVEKLREARRIGGLERHDTRAVGEPLRQEQAEQEEIAEPVASITPEELDVLVDEDAEKPLVVVGDPDAEEEFGYYEDSETETEPVRARTIPREIDAPIEPVVALDEDENEDDDDDEIDEDADEEFEDEESSDEPIVIAAEIGSFDEETLEDDDVFEEDELDEEDGVQVETVIAETVLAEKTIEPAVVVSAPVIQSAAAPELEPLALPSVNVAPVRPETVRTEAIQPGLFDAPIAASAAVPAPTPARVETPAPVKAAPVLQPAARKETPAPTPPVTQPKKEVMPAAVVQPKPASQAKPARASTPAEKEVVLQPVAAAPSERSVKSTSPEGSRQTLLSEIGCLFIERGRVAVSMLQRQHGMDFDEACKVLDDLQEMGLIGPYLGGQRRDILLTREQWLERVSQAGAAR